MGCMTYEYDGKLIRFSDDNDDWRCLCTFPYNDGEQLDELRARSLLLFGAVIAMIQNGDENFSEYQNDDYIFLPAAAPDWLVKEIERLIPLKGQS